MSKYLLREWFGLCPDGICDVSVLTESERREMKDSGVMYLVGVMQRANARNQNGRIYPKDVLVREVENYKKLIRENRALGECVDEETQIKTSQGWKFLKDISENESVLVLDEFGDTREEDIKRKIVLPFEGNLLRFQNTSKTLDMMLTPNHKVIVQDSEGKTRALYAEEVATRIYENKSKDLYIPSEYMDRNISLDTRFVSVEKVPYSGNVYCVETSTGNWLMKRNGHACWTHNCDHPEDSVVNLKNVSHMVTDVWWQGDDVMGKIKILTTPSGLILKELLKNGVQLGISSRSLGSVREEAGGSVVNSDLSLIAWDMVAEPSTHGAFMNLKESTIKENQVFSKADRINRALNLLNFERK